MIKFYVERIKELRVAKGISQKKLGELLGVSDRAVSKWETGLSNPTAENMIRLARIFEVPLEHFLEEEKAADVKHAPKPAGMQSIMELYKIGRGPSSSHTIGPERACLAFSARNPDADSFGVTLYGSLAKTGKGHGTDVVIVKTFLPKPCEVLFDMSETNKLYCTELIAEALKEATDFLCL